MSSETQQYKDAVRFNQVIYFAILILFQHLPPATIGKVVQQQETDVLIGNCPVEIALDNCFHFFVKLLLASHPADSIYKNTAGMVKLRAGTGRRATTKA